ncbi:DUF3298 domain-containing protein [Bacillaceae bacterium S4-13-56]
MNISLPVNMITMKSSYGPNKEIYYPKIISMQNEQLQNNINQSIIGETQKLINQQMGEMPSPLVEMLGTYEMKNNQRDVLSLLFSNYAYHYHAAHGMTYLKSLTFDLIKGTSCTLHDLFKPGSNYIEQISIQIQNQINQREIPTLTEFKTIKPNQEFYIADKTLVIYFQLYELTPYVFGFPMFPISVYDLQDIINENGPLGRMAANN